jgi:hypothetical protein
MVDFDWARYAHHNASINGETRTFTHWQVTYKFDHLTTHGRAFSIPFILNERKLNFKMMKPCQASSKEQTPI